ncbi:MAG: hypothetical protein AMXMBFR84_12410 [Candidatus Hydrogenedentota bacterium]
MKRHVLLALISVMLLGTAFVWWNVRPFDTIEFRADLKQGETTPFLWRDSSSRRPVFTAAQTAVAGTDVVHQLPESMGDRFLASKHYDLAMLPNPITLKSIEVIDAGVLADGLIVSNLDGIKRVRIDDEETFQLDGREWNFVGVSPWGGLIADERGSPMAALALRANDAEPWQEPVLLGNAVWLTVPPDTALYFDWFDDRATAEIAQQNELTGIHSARWGVREGENIHWFSSFEPGGGVVLNDGTAVTLLQYEEAFSFPDGIAPAIQVETLRQDEKTRDWIQANSSSEENIVLFEDTALSGRVWIVYAWADDTGWAALYEDGTQIAARGIGRGDVFQPEDGGPALRVDHLLATGVPVLPQSVEVRGLRIRRDGQELWLPEGNPTVLGESTVIYRRFRIGRVVDCELGISGDSPLKKTLSHDGTLDLGPWRLHLSSEPPLEDDRVTIVGRYHGQAAAAAMIQLALIGLSGLTALLSAISYFRLSKENPA